MAGAGGEDWIYVLSQQEAVEDAEAEQAVTADAVTATATATATAAGEENNKPSKNPDDDGETAAAAGAEEEEEKESNDDDDEASAQPSEDSDNNAAAQKPSSKDGGAAQPSSSDDQDRLFEEGEEEFFRATYTQGEIECEKAYRAYIAALERAGKIDEEAERAYIAALERAAKIDEKAHRTANDDDTYEYDDDMYGTGPAPYYRGGYGYGGSSGPASLGLGSGYDDYNRYYDRYGYGFPGAYGPAPDTGSGYGYGYGYGYGGYYYGETYPYVPSGYLTVVHQAPPPPAFSVSIYPLVLPPMPYVYPAPAPAYVPSARPGLRGRYPARADEPSPPAVAPTTQPKPEPSQHY